MYAISRHMAQLVLCFVALAGGKCCSLQIGAKSGHLDSHDAQSQWLVRVLWFCIMFQAPPPWSDSSSFMHATRSGRKDVGVLQPKAEQRSRRALRVNSSSTARSAATLPAKLLRRLSTCRHSLSQGGLCARQSPLFVECVPAHATSNGVKNAAAHPCGACDNGLPRSGSLTADRTAV